MKKPKAIILAAGVGQRLGDSADGRPKCLLEFGGSTLLARHLKILDHYGISGVLLVTGYGAAQIEAELAQLNSRCEVSTVHNPEYEKGSVISLLTGLRALSPDRDILLMDADVLYDHRLIGRLLQAEGNRFLLDREFEAGEDPVKLCVKDGHLIDFRKQINKDLEFDFQGESVGFFRFTNGTAGRLAQRARTYIESGDGSQPYEECIRDLLLEKPDDFCFEDITGLPWIEIDFPGDIRLAESGILPRLTEPERADGNKS